MGFFQKCVKTGGPEGTLGWCYLGHVGSTVLLGVVSDSFVKGWMCVFVCFYEKRGRCWDAWV